MRSCRRMLKNPLSLRLLMKGQMSFDRLRTPSAVEGQGGVLKPERGVLEVRRSECPGAWGTHHRWAPIRMGTR